MMVLNSFLFALCSNVPIPETVLKSVPNIFLDIIVDNWEFHCIFKNQQFVKILANIIHQIKNIMYK